MGTHLRHRTSLPHPAATQSPPPPQATALISDGADQDRTGVWTSFGIAGAERDVGGGFGVVLDRSHRRSVLSSAVSSRRLLELPLSVLGSRELTASRQPARTDSLCASGRHGAPTPSHAIHGTRMAPDLHRGCPRAPRIQNLHIRRVGMTDADVGRTGRGEREP